jgi:hypothetical protein
VVAVVAALMLSVRVVFAFLAHSSNPDTNVGHPGANQPEIRHHADGESGVIGARRYVNAVTKDHLDNGHGLGGGSAVLRPADTAPVLEPDTGPSVFIEPSSRATGKLRTRRGGWEVQRSRP